MSRNASHVCGAATGTATTTFDGPSRRKACTATRIVEPVARPSSTRMVVLPRRSGNGRVPRYCRSRLSMLGILVAFATAPRGQPQIACREFARGTWRRTLLDPLELSERVGLISQNGVMYATPTRTAVLLGGFSGARKLREAKWRT